MIWDIAVILAKIFGIFLLVCFLRAVQLHYQVQAQLNRLQREGIKSYPGNDAFLLGPMVRIGAEYNERNKAGEQMPTQMVWLMQQLTKETRQPGDPMTDARLHRMVAVNLIGKVITFVQDPVVLSDLIGKHNAHFDKHEYTFLLFEPLSKGAFATMKTDDVWKT